MKKIMDERITKTTNELAATGWLMIMALQAGVLAAKLTAGAPMYTCILDTAVLAAGFLGMVILRTAKGLWGAKDEALREIERAGLAKVFTVQFWMLIIGEFLLVFMDEGSLRWYAPYPVVWLIPALYIVVKGVRSGCYVWGGRKAAEDGKARLLKGTIIGAAFFGIIMGGPACFQDGVFQPLGLLEVVSMGAFWGVLYYWMFRWLMKRGEKAADRAVAASEGANADEE